MPKRKHGNRFSSNKDLVEKRVLRTLKDSLAARQSATAQIPPSPTMQQRFDQQATEWLDRQPRILNGLADFRELERLALVNDVKGMAALLKKRAREAAAVQLTHWKEFFRLQRRPGRPSEQWIEDAQRKWMLGESYEAIAAERKSNGDRGATKAKVSKALRDYRKRAPRGIAQPTKGRGNPSH